MNAVAVVPRETIEDVDVERIDIGTNVRVDETDLIGLAASIKAEGLAQPVQVVGPHADGRYRLVYGQRRLLASRLAQLPTIRAIVLAESDVDEPGSKRAILQLAENSMRADLNPIEEALALREVLAGDPTLTQASLAEKLGRSAPWVANTLGLLEAAEPVQVAIRSGQLTASHAKALRGLAPKTQAEVAQRAIEENLSAHGAEQLVQQLKRNEDWRKQQEAREREAAAARRAQNEATIATLEKRKVGKDARILVEKGYYGGSNAGHVAELIRKAGYTNVEVETTVAAKPKGVPCDCDAWRISLTYEGRIAIGPACVKTQHQRAKNAADEDARKAKYATEARVQARLAEVLPAALSAQPLDPLAARVALWIALGYGVANWSEQRGGKRTKPWDAIAALPDAELPAELGKALAAKFRDQFGYHLPWDEIEAQLGEVTAQSEAAERVRTKRAARVEVAGTLEADAGVDAPMCMCGKPKVQAGAHRWVCTNPDHKASEQ